MSKNFPTVSFYSTQKAVGYPAVYPYVVRVYNSDSQKVTAAIKMIKHFKVREGTMLYIYLPLIYITVRFLFLRTA